MSRGVTARRRPGELLLADVGFMYNVKYVSIDPVEYLGLSGYICVKFASDNLVCGNIYSVAD